MESGKRLLVGVGLTVVFYVLIFWVILPSFLFGLGFRLDNLVPIRWTIPFPLKHIGGILACLGFALIAISMRHLWIRGKGLPISHLPPKTFVRTGVYKHLRHPIYVGYTAAFSGTALLVGSFWSLAFSMPLLVLGWVGYALFYEEPGLLARFGDQYAEYKQQTPLFIPKRLGRKVTAALHPVFKRTCNWLTRLADQTILIRRGNLILASYGIFVAVGSLVFMMHITVLFLTQGVEKKDILLYLVSAAFLTAFFAHVFWWLGHWKEMLKLPLLGLRKVGFVSYGALFGLFLSSFLFARLLGYNILMVADVVVRGMFIAYALGRVGCLTYGCCWGTVSSTYGICYQNPQAKVVRLNGKNSVPRHPTPVYSAIEGFLIFILLNGLAYFPLPAGFLTAFMFLLYPVVRAFIESYRERRLVIFRFFNEGHIGCAALFLTGLALLALLSPGVDSFSPRPWNVPALLDSLTLIPVVLVMSLFIFFVTSFHWKKVGTW